MRAKMAFERRDLLADRGLAHADFARRRSETPALDDADEKFERIQTVHSLPPKISGMELIVFRSAFFWTLGGIDIVCPSTTTKRRSK
ncbi:hypothetical protein HDG34_007351 [Paraburkholderia sp. HC6.4b]|uniref:hypothetical protein n=1 Tax=unclassified Paraburkholderia TaxID=2615204 RepID=UPI0018197B90|nr:MULTISPECIES: hypothetical protein [unclassified Paraburkholderia]MBB5413373.1 hypothetical protein [Paraburkholderia sp. HC6.4b]MBB5455627.1 hypothetical protein [Paraburkholderia sp. Kb1A]